MNNGSIKEQTGSELRRAAVDHLRKEGVESADLDARVLFCYAIGIEPDKFHLFSDQFVRPQVEAKFWDFLARRIKGEPVARIVGCKEFWSRSFALNRDTLVPRPETETVVEAVLSVIGDRRATFRLIDLGTGSGILLAAILSEYPNSFGLGLDRNERALRQARENLVSLGLEARSGFICGDWGDALSSQFDLVVANPPYISSGDLRNLPREVRDHDPRLALDGGADGLEAYKKIISRLPQLLKPNGTAVLELGAGQESAVAEITRRTHIKVVGPAKRDLAGSPRALILGL